MEEISNLVPSGTPLPERITEKVLKESGLSINGIAAVEVALDPFHDFNVNHFRGWVDTHSGDTVTQVFTTQRTVTSDLSDTETWDVQFIMSESDVSVELMQAATLVDSGTNTIRNVLQTNFNANQPLGVKVTADSPVTNYGGLTITRNLSSAANVSPFVFTGSHNSVSLDFNGTVAAPGGATVSNSRPYGAYRVISAGFEVYDETAELYKQGASTMWRWPDFEEEITYVYSKGVTQSGGGSVFAQNVRAKCNRKPPMNDAQARILPRTKTGLARDGAYIVGTMRNGILPPRRITDEALLYSNEGLNAMTSAIDETSNDAVWVANPGKFVTTATGFQTDPTLLGFSTPYHDSGLNPCGVIFTGLHPLASLRVVYKVVVEMCPTLYDTQLIPLTTPSAPLDVKALELYSKLVSTVPVGTAVGNNANGDYWKGIMGNIGKAYKIGKRVLDAAGLVPELAPVTVPLQSMVRLIDGLYEKGIHAKTAQNNLVGKEAKKIKRDVQQITNQLKALGKQPKSKK